MNPEAKARIEALRGSRASDVLAEYLGYKLDLIKSNLTTVPIEQVQRLQGKAQQLQELITFFTRKE